jgi:hypothetical protein
MKTSPSTRLALLLVAVLLIANTFASSMRGRHTTRATSSQSASTLANKRSGMIYWLTPNFSRCIRNRFDFCSTRLFVVTKKLPFSIRARPSAPQTYLSFLSCSIFIARCTCRCPCRGACSRRRTRSRRGGTS